MKLKKRGKNTLKNEILHISPFGFWIDVLGKEYFLSFKQYPWFKDASVAEICHFELLHKRHLHWPDLDVDLDLNSLEHPEKYPLSWQPGV